MAANELSKAWFQVVDERIALKWWEKVTNAYNEPQRAYHTMVHIESMYSHYQRYCDELHLSSKNIVFVLAIVFHDIVYDPLSKSNELDSIEIFRIFVKESSFPLASDDISLIESMIEATIRHQVPQGMSSIDTHIVACFLDFDLAILGQSQSEYDTYSKQIRQEYTIYDDATYCKGRAAVLRSFLAREQLYFTAQYNKNNESLARTNISREIAALNSNLV